MLDLVHTDIYENEELKHWGIIGMKWGIRRYQNPDGTLTPEGRERYLKSGDKGKINYINDNWKRAEKEAKAYMISNKKYEKFVNNHFYREYRNGKYKDDPDAFKKYYRPDIFIEQGVDEEYVDYDTILGAKTQEFLEKEFSKKLYENRQNTIHEMMLYKKDPSKSFNDEAKEAGYSSSADLVKNIFTKSVKDSDFDQDELSISSAKDIMRIYGLNNKDLAMNDEGFIVRKDGKDFEFEIDGKKVYSNNLGDAHKTLMTGANPVTHKYDNFDPIIAYKNFEKNFKGSLEDETWGESENTPNLRSFKQAVPIVNDKDLDTNVRHVMNIFGLNKEDLVIDKKYSYGGYIYRRDGLPFIYSPDGINGKKIKQMDLQYLAEEGDWSLNTDFTVFDNKGNPRIDLKMKNIESLVWSHPEFYKITNENSSKYGKYTYDGNQYFDSINDLVEYIKKEES